MVAIAPPSPPRKKVWLQGGRNTRGRTRKLGISRLQRTEAGWQSFPVGQAGRSASPSFRGRARLYATATPIDALGTLSPIRRKILGVYS